MTLHRLFIVVPAQNIALPSKPKIISRGGAMSPGAGLHLPISSVSSNVGRQPSSSPSPSPTTARTMTAHQSQRGMSPRQQKRMSSGDANGLLNRCVGYNNVVVALVVVVNWGH